MACSVRTLLLTLGLGLLGAFAAPGQTTPGEGLVYDLRRTIVTYEADGTHQLEVTTVAQVKNEAGVKELAILKIPYSAEDQVVEVAYVRVRKPDGTVILTPATNIQDQAADLSRNAPMYSDIREKHILVRALGAGDVLETLIRVRSVKAEFPGCHWYAFAPNEWAAVREEVLELHLPSALGFLVRSPKFKAQEATQNGRTVLRWRWTNLAPVAKVPRFRLEAPVPAIQISTFRSWAEVGRWYDALQAPKMVLTPRLRAKAAELTRGLEQDEAKLRALYDYVAQKFHYISISFGVGRFQPHAAEEVLDNEYGDCKDKHTLLAALLRASGFEAWPALVRAGGKLDPDQPSPGPFNHVITVVPRGKELLWLDTTAEVAPFGFITFPVRGRSALVIPSQGPATLMTIPDRASLPATMALTTTGAFDPQGGFSGEVALTARGDHEIGLRQVFRNLPQAQWKDFVKQAILQTQAVVDIDNLTTSAPANTRDAFQLTFALKLPSPGSETRFMALPLPRFGLEGWRLDKEKDPGPVFLGLPGTIVYKAELHLPPAWSSTVPDPVAYTCPSADYHTRYTRESDLLHAERTLLLKEAEASPEAIEGLRTFRASVSQDEALAIPMRQAAAEGLDKLDQEGGAALQRGEFKLAQSHFSQVLAKDPRYPAANARLGLSLLGQGRTEEALKALQRESQYHPERPWNHAVVAGLLLSLGRSSDGWEAAMKILALKPVDKGSVALVVDAALHFGSNSGGLPFLEAAASEGLGLDRLEWALSCVYLRTGQAQKGFERLQRSLGEDPSANDLYQASQALAEAGLELETALAWNRKATEKMQAEGNPRAAQWARLWDTLGWIRFRQGDVATALTYVRAAWLTLQEREIGEHLAQIYENQGKKTQAAYQATLAKACEGPFNGMAMPTPPPSDRTHLGGPPVMARSRKPLLDPAEVLGNMRTYPLPYLPRRTGNAGFELIFTKQGLATATLEFGEPWFSEEVEKLKKLHFRIEFPDDSPARLVRKGILTYSGKNSVLTLLPAEPPRRP